MKSRVLRLLAFPNLRVRCTTGHAFQARMCHGSGERMVYDLSIVGAGMFGSAAARHASVNPSVKVALIGPDEPKDDKEKQQRKIFSAHYDEGRITRVFDGQIICQKLGDESIKRYREIETLSGTKFYNPVGLLALGDKGNEELEQVKHAIALGKVPALELDSQLIKHRYPFFEVGKDDVGFLDDNGAGWISARRLVAAQQKIARFQGCKIIRGIVKEVTPMKEDDDCSYHEVVLENGDHIRSKRVLVSPGAFVKLKPLIPNDDGFVPDVKMIPDTAVLLRIPEKEAMRLMSMPTLIYYGSKKSAVLDHRSYILPPVKYPNGHYYVKIGYSKADPELTTVEEVRKWYLSEGNPKIVETRSKLLKELIIGLKVEEVKGLACLIAVTLSGLPYIDRISPTLSVAFGGNGKSAKFSDEIGRLAAELALYGRWDTELPRSSFKIQWKKP